MGVGSYMNFRVCSLALCNIMKTEVKKVDERVIQKIDVLRASVQTLILEPVVKPFVPS
jgi:hypothetical protein